MDPAAERRSWDYKFDALRILFAINFSLLFLLQSQTLFEAANMIRILRIALFSLLIIAVATIVFFPLPQFVYSKRKKMRNTYVVLICRVIIYAYVTWLIWMRFLT